MGLTETICRLSRIRAYYKANLARTETNEMFQLHGTGTNAPKRQSHRLETHVKRSIGVSYQLMAPTFTSSRTEHTAAELSNILSCYQKGARDVSFRRCFLWSIVMLIITTITNTTISISLFT